MYVLSTIVKSALGFFWHYLGLSAEKHMCKHVNRNKYVCTEKLNEREIYLHLRPIYFLYLKMNFLEFMLSA